MLYQTIAILMLVGDIAWWRWALRRVRGLWKYALGLFVVLQLFYMLRILLTPYTARHDSNPINVALTSLAYVWHLLVLPITLITIGIHSAVSWVWVKPRSRPVGAPAPAYEPVGPIVHRRQVLAAVPPLLAGAALGLSLSELHRFRVRRMQLPLRGLPAALDGMTIAHVCDTHIGRFTDDAMLRDITRATNDLDADLTLFIGDLIDVALADLGPAIAFAKTLRGRYGVYFCEGNHDLIDDTAHETRIFETATRDAGLAMLFDETATVWVRGVPIQLVGGRWNQTPKRRVQQTTALMRLVDPGVFSIFLSHHPHAWDQSITPLTLSGHTHGGQLMLNERLGVGPIMFRYWSGLYQRGDQTLVVCNGTGNWYPLRTNAPAEIIHLTLRCVS